MITEAVLERYLVREVLEDYLGALDRKDWDAIAACFTDDARSQYNLEPGWLEGGKGVADWLHVVAAYNATNHGLSNAKIEVEGQQAYSESLVVATLHEGGHGRGRVLVRGISYQDWLVKVEDQWKIRKRIHQPTWQYDAVSQSLFLYEKQDG